MTLALPRLNRVPADQRGITIVLITHERQVAEYGSRIVTFKDGHIVSDVPNVTQRSSSPVEKLVMAAGAGFHEELIFRVVIMGGLAWLLTGLTGPGRAWIVALVLSSLALLAVGVAFWYIAKHRLPFWTTCDVFAPGIALGHVTGRLGCLAAGCCYGRPADVPWAIDVFGADGTQTIVTIHRPGPAPARSPVTANTSATGRRPRSGIASAMSGPG